MRIIGHVLKYGTKPGSFTPLKPFQASLLVWDLTAKRFDLLMSIFKEHGNLSEKDLLLGPCDNKKMQKFDIGVGGGNAAYLETEQTRAYAVEIISEGRVPNLANVAGKLPSEFEM